VFSCLISGGVSIFIMAIISCVGYCMNLLALICYTIPAVDRHFSNCLNRIDFNSRRNFSSCLSFFYPYCVWMPHNP
jgi:hypothetical protein